MRLQRLVRVYTCHNVKLLEITCHGSYVLLRLFLQDSGSGMAADSQVMSRIKSLESENSNLKRGNTCQSLPPVPEVWSLGQNFFIS